MVIRADLVWLTLQDDVWLESARGIRLGVGCVRY